MFQNTFQGHVSCYPHNTAYRPIAPTISLQNAWKYESLEALNLYLHIPFGESHPRISESTDKELISKYLETVDLQARQIRHELSTATFGSLIIGGGSPTCLSIEHWKQVFETLHGTLGVGPQRIPISCQGSPATIDEAKLVFLREQGVDRLSLAVQSHETSESSRSGQPQDSTAVAKAIELIRQAEFPTLNLRLIYGARQQCTESWLQMVDLATHYRAEEVSLDPLYLSPPATPTAGNQGQQLSGQLDWDTQRLDAYRAARDYLSASGYEQVSFRKFQRSDAKPECQSKFNDFNGRSQGTIGLGCVARSYTRDLHYSLGLDCAVDNGQVVDAVNAYVNKTAEEFRVVQHGHYLNLEDQKRRFVIAGLLRSEGADTLDYEARFGSYVMQDLPQLLELVLNGYMHWDDTRLQLTHSGLELSDAIGPWLYSDKVNSLMETCECC